MPDTRTSAHPKPGGVLSDVHVMDCDGASAPLCHYAHGGMLLLIVYRGSWSAFCLKRLADYRDNAARFQALGVQLAAFSTDTPEVASRMRASLELPFPVLCDPDRALLSDWDLVNAHRMRTAHPATLLIDASRAVRFVSIDDSYATARVPDVLERCRALLSGQRPVADVQRVLRIPGLVWWVQGARDEIALRWRASRAVRAAARHPSRERPTNPGSAT